MRSVGSYWSWKYIEIHSTNKEHIRSILSKELGHASIHQGIGLLLPCQRDQGATGAPAARHAILHPTSPPTFTQAAGTVGYACPHYVNNSVVTERSEVLRGRLGEASPPDHGLWVHVFAYGPKTGAAFFRFFAFNVRVLRNGLLLYILEHMSEP